MRIGIALLVGILLLLLGHSSVYGLWETERSDAIGQSPGAFVELTRSGTTAAVDSRARTLVMQDANGHHTVSTPEPTHT
jgi:hypothetical protein